MRQKNIYGLYGLLSAVLALLIFTGCGGGGGPIRQPETGPGPSVPAQFTELLPAVQRSATGVGSQQCAECHQEPYHREWSQTRHAQVNVGCESCHGNGSVHVAAPSRDNILTYPGINEGIVCGQCHGPTHEQWQDSRHSGVVDEVIEEGESNGVTCFRCHSGTFRAQMVDARLALGKTPDEIDADIRALSREQMANFVHASHASATCANCHDPHRQTANLTSDGNQAHLRRATFNLSTEGIQPGAPVRQYTVYNHVCSSCHNGRGANPADSALQSGTARPNMHDSNQHNMLLGISGVEGSGGPVVRQGAHTTTPDQCVHCHLPNRRHTFTVSLDTSCAPCHTPADAAARHQSVRAEVLSGLLALRIRMERWAQAQFPSQTFNQNFWNYTSLIQAAAEEGSVTVTPPPQNQIPIEIKRARHNYYFVLRDRSLGIHNTPYARHLLSVANQQLDTLGVSRSATRSPLAPDQIQAILQRDLRHAKAADAQSGHEM